MKNQKKSNLFNCKNSNAISDDPKLNCFQNLVLAVQKSVKDYLFGGTNIYPIKAIIIKCLKNKNLRKQIDKC